MARSIPHPPAARAYPPRRWSRLAWVLLVVVTLAAGLGVFRGFPLRYELDPSAIKAEPEVAYRVTLPEPAWPFRVESDGPEAKRRSRAALLEDGEAIGPAHALHGHIRRLGSGRYSHWRGQLRFSTSDNSDPRSNGRRYLAVLPGRLPPAALAAVLGLWALAGTSCAIRWQRRGLVGWPDLLLPVALWSGAALSLGALPQVGGVVLWLLLGIGLSTLIWALATTRQTFRKGAGKPWRAPRLPQRLTLLTASTALTLVVAEGLLMIRERRGLTPERPEELLQERPEARSGKDAFASSRPKAEVAQLGGGRSDLVPIQASLDEDAAPDSAAERPAPAGKKEQRPASGTDRTAKVRGATPTDSEPAVREPETEAFPIEPVLASFGVTVPRALIAAAARRQELLTLPPEYERTPVQVQGAVSAFSWHGVVHVRDRNHLRRTTPFPPRQEGIFRVMVVGDSLTYGQGVANEWTYSSQLETLLRRDHHAEVLNLGVPGYQSEDILSQTRSFLPELDPDLVIYGVCSNDFLPSGVGQYANNYAYRLPLPDPFKEHLIDRSRIAQLTTATYNQALLRFGLRVDFFDDILNGFAAYQTRYARDVAELNSLVRAQGLPPVVALAFEANPIEGSRQQRLSQTAEKHLKAAGMDVIESAEYYRRFSGHRLGVSRWDGHPNEVAHAIWATMLDRHLRSLPALHPFRKTPG